MKLTTSQFANIFSALQTAERDLATGDRRRHSRINISDAVKVIEVATGRAYRALTRDICFTGLSLLQSKPAAVRDQLTVEIRQGKPQPYRVRCLVANIREVAEGLYCIGCVFAMAEADPVTVGSISAVKGGGTNAATSAPATTAPAAAAPAAPAAATPTAASPAAASPEAAKG